MRGSILTTSVSILLFCLPFVATATNGDYDGDGKTDFIIVRNSSGNTNGQLTWYIKPANGGTQSILNWGLNLDVPVQGDFDGDNKTDVAIWRSGSPFTAAFYILQSSNNTFRIEVFGMTGDDPTVVNDFDGDGKTDIAVYRSGIAQGEQSFFYYRGSFNNPNGNITYIHYGTSGDFAFTGYFDNDNKADFGIQRNYDSQSHALIFQQHTNSNDTVSFYGLSTDLLAPGDYDGDGKTDLTVVRREAFGNLYWYIRRSSDGNMMVVSWGLADGDYICQGDYDGDGKTDVAIWRPNLDFGMNYFYVLQSATGTLLISEWGIMSDYPVSNYNIH